jgi:hypothetical protein
VLDSPGAHGKTPIGPGYIVPEEAGVWRILDASGGSRLYRDVLRG